MNLGSPSIVFEEHKSESKSTAKASKQIIDLLTQKIDGKSDP
jgi:hypothetical protein